MRICTQPTSRVHLIQWWIILHFSYGLLNLHSGCRKHALKDSKKEEIHTPFHTICTLHTLTLARYSFWMKSCLRCLWSWMDLSVVLAISSTPDARRSSLRVNKQCQIQTEGITYFSSCKIFVWVLCLVSLIQWKAKSHYLWVNLRHFPSESSSGCSSCKIMSTEFF